MLMNAHSEVRLRRSDGGSASAWGQERWAPGLQIPHPCISDPALPPPISHAGRQPALPRLGRPAARAPAAGGRAAGQRGQVGQP